MRFCPGLHALGSVRVIELGSLGFVQITGLGHYCGVLDSVPWQRGSLDLLLKAFSGSGSGLTQFDGERQSGTAAHSCSNRGWKPRDEGMIGSLIRNHLRDPALAT